MQYFRLCREPFRARKALVDKCVPKTSMTTTHTIQFQGVCKQIFFLEYARELCIIVLRRGNRVQQTKGTEKIRNKRNKSPIEPRRAAAKNEKQGLPPPLRDSSRPLGRYRELSLHSDHLQELRH